MPLPRPVSGRQFRPTEVLVDHRQFGIKIVVVRDDGIYLSKAEAAVSFDAVRPSHARSFDSPARRASALGKPWQRQTLVGCVTDAAQSDGTESAVKIISLDRPN